MLFNVASLVKIHDSMLHNPYNNLEILCHLDNTIDVGCRAALLLQSRKSLPVQLQCHHMDGMSDNIQIVPGYIHNKFLTTYYPSNNKDYKVHILLLGRGKGILINHKSFCE